MEDRRAWYVAEAGEVYGPLSEQDVVTLIQGGRISRSSFLYHFKFSAWVRLDSLEDFRHLLPPARERAMYHGIAGAFALVALLVLPRVASKLSTINEALGNPYWAQMTLSEYLMVAIPVGFFGMLLVLALVMAARRR